MKGRLLFILHPSAFILQRKRCPICSVPKVPMPLRRKLKTTRFSCRSPTLNVKYWPVTAQQSQAWPTVTTELMREELPLPGRFWKSKKKDAPPKSPRSRSPRKTEGLHCEPCSVPGSLPKRSLKRAIEGASVTARV